MESVDYRAVIGAIKDTAGTLIDIDSNKGWIKRLIHKAALTLTSSAVLYNKSVEVDVHNGTVKLPCDLMRILRVTDVHGRKTGWNRRHGNSAITTTLREGKIHIHYRALPLTTITDVDGEEQVISITPEAIDYCALYAIVTILKVEFSKGNIRGDIFAMWQNDMDMAHGKAKGNVNMLSIDEAEAMVSMMHHGQFIGRH